LPTDDLETDATFFGVCFLESTFFGVALAFYGVGFADAFLGDLVMAGLVFAAAFALVYFVYLAIWRSLSTSKITKLS
jgi:hypothetical protein